MWDYGTEGVRSPRTDHYMTEGDDGPECPAFPAANMPPLRDG